MTVQQPGNGTRASYAYDDANQLLRVSNINQDSTTISAFNYAYDKGMGVINELTQKYADENNVQNEPIA